VEPSEPTEPIQPVSQKVYQVTDKKGSFMRGAGLVGVLVIIVLAGVGTGYGLSRVFGNTGTGGSDSDISAAPGSLSANQVEVGKLYGTVDEKKFPDTSEGIVEKGGVDGEGTHHLIRPGGASQTVYMTSSVVDLDLFNGHKVIVQGETFSAQKAAWFMDVGNVKVLELNVKTDTTSEDEVPAE